MVKFGTNCPQFFKIDLTVFGQFLKNFGQFEPELTSKTVNLTLALQYLASRVRPRLWPKEIQVLLFSFEFGAKRFKRFKRFKRTPSEGSPEVTLCPAIKCRNVVILCKMCLNIVY